MENVEYSDLEPLQRQFIVRLIELDKEAKKYAQKSKEYEKITKQTIKIAKEYRKIYKKLQDTKSNEYFRCKY